MEAREGPALEEMGGGVALQGETWGYEGNDIIPRRGFVVARHVGGAGVGGVGAGGRMRARRIDGEVWAEDPALELPMAQRGIVGGDRACAAIAAASILAKVRRDALMADLHHEDPRYGFDRHKGYATADHLAAVERFGISAAHRRSFRPPSLLDGLE